MPATDALILRTLVTEQMEGKTFRTILEGFVKSETRQAVAAGLETKSLYERKFGPDRFANALKMAETYYLSPDMQELVQQAATADDYPEDEAILKEDPPSEAGFMHIPGRFRVIELRGRLMIAHAVVWLGNSVWWLCDRRDPDDEMNQYLNEMLGDQKDMPRYDLMEIDTFDFGQPLYKTLRFEKGVLPFDAKIEWQRLPDGRVGLHTDHVLAGKDGLPTPSEQQSPSLRFLLTTWRLMQQTLAEVEREDKAGKADRRYAHRAGIKDTSVTVISLRRRKSHATGTGSPLTCRFPVRGHWSRRWCGSGLERVLRAVYIHPYIRGPEGAPIIVRSKVNALIR